MLLDAGARFQSQLSLPQPHMIPGVGCFFLT
jgi:hypothetical protein